MPTMEDRLREWLDAPAESERLEFKRAEKQFGSQEARRYCAALANEGGGHLVLGVTDRPPRSVVGTAAFAGQNALNDIKKQLLGWLHLRVDLVEMLYEGNRVLIFDVPSRLAGCPVEVDGAFLMRSGESLVPMSVDRLKAIFAETEPDWMDLPATDPLPASEVVALLDTQGVFDLLGEPYPSDQAAVLSRLASNRIVVASSGQWRITNLGALAAAKRLSAVSSGLGRKAPRFVVYDGVSKASTRTEHTIDRGLAVGFQQLVELVHAAAPRNRVIEQAIRTEVQMFPQQALRELIANALIHQDFTVTGARVMIELFNDRVQITNPGIPPISLDRFIDEYRSRNESFADLLRRMGICEEKGSGIDKVIDAVEVYQLPAPDFLADDLRTIAILYSHRDFGEMGRPDRVRACYQHCCLMWVTNKRMTNESLRGRFGLTVKQSTTASAIIAATREAGLIDLEPTESTSTRYAQYRPFWA